MTKVSKRFIFILLAIFALASFIFVFSVNQGAEFSANAAVISNTTGTSITDGEVDTYSTLAIDTLASATLKAYYKDYGTGSVTRVANAYVQRTITLSVTDPDIIAAAASGRMKAKVLLTGTNSFPAPVGTQNISTSMIYALSGGIASSNINLAEQASFTDQSISQNFLSLTPSNGVLDIIITATAVHHAETPGGGTGEVVAEASLECTLTVIEVLFSFDDIEVTLTITGNGKVTENKNSVETQYTSSQALTYTFGDTVSFTASGNANMSYFRGWSVSGTPVNTLVATLPHVHDIPYNVNPSYTATFANFDVASNLSVFPHNADIQGPKVNETNMAAFKRYHNYVGTDALGNGFGPSTAKPSNSGSYTYTFDIYFDVGGANGDKVGSLTKTFDIVKDKPVVTPNQIVPYELYLGDALGDIVFSVSAAHSRTNTPINGTWVFIEEPATELVGGQQVITISTATAAAPRDTTALLNTTTGADLYFRFTPAEGFTLNSSISWGKVTLIVEDAISNDSVNVDGLERAVNITKSIVTTKDANVLNNLGAGVITKEAVKISLRATFNDTTGRYFFLGFRFGENLGEGEYDYYYLTAGGTTFDPVGNGLSFDYYLPEWVINGKTTRDSLTTASVQAVFVEDTSTDLGGNELAKRYTGSSIVFSPTFNPSNNAEYAFNWTSAEYYVGGTWGSTAPSAIGSYNVRYNIRNADSSVGTYPVVGLRQFTLVITPTVIVPTRKTSGTIHTATGWATAHKYELSSQGTVSGAVTRYYYSTDYNSGNPSASTWTMINLDPALSSGCVVTYDLPLPNPEPGNAGGSSAINYTFMAVGPGGATVNYGGVDYSLVSIAEPKMIKIDTYVPSISGIVMGQYINSEWVVYNGAPTNQPVYFRVTTNYGGSGAQLYILNAGKTVLFNSSLPNPSFNPGTDASIKTNQLVEIMLNLEYRGNVYIQVRNPLNKSVIFKQGDPLADVPFPVHIDFTPPTITYYSSTFSANANGWVNYIPSFYYTVADLGSSDSGVETATYVCEGANAIVPSTEGTIYNRICEIKIDDNKQYNFSVTDKAGNNKTVQIQANIDTESIIFEAKEEGYNSGEWLNGVATINASVTAGASSLKYEYKTSSGSYTLWNPQESFVQTVYDDINLVYKSERDLSISPGSTGIMDTYSIRITNMAGTQIVFPFDVKLDVFNPTISLITNLSPYQGSTWTQNAVNIRFDVADSSHTFNSGINQVFVNDGTGNVLQESMSGQPLSFQYSVVKCTSHTISVYDASGNVVTYSFTLKVDLGTPNITGQLYVGGADPQNPTTTPDPSENEAGDIYQYLNTSRYVTELDLEPWIRVEFALTITASGSVLQQSKDKITWITMSENMIPAGAATQENRNIRLFFTEEQVSTYYFRLVTGGNRYTYMMAGAASEVGPPEPYPIRIDKTKPVLDQKFIVDRVETDLTSVWARQNSTWRFKLVEDSLKGSGIKSGTVKLYSWPYATTNQDIESQFAAYPVGFTGVEVTLSAPVQGEYTHTLSVDSLKYVVYCEDNAGHKSINIVFPKLDFTANFYIASISATVTKLDGGASTNEYSENLWLPADERVNFSITSAFNELSGRTSFGPSGGGIAFSVNGGATWQTTILIEGNSQAITLLGVNSYGMQASNPQYYQYMFRAFTGAGYVSPYVTSNYWVKKDNVSPEVTLDAIYTAGAAVDEPYLGDWIDGIVKINIETTLGPCFGSLYYATSPAGGGEIGSYILLKTISRNDVTYNSGTSDYTYNGLIDIRVTKNLRYFVKLVTKKDPVTPGTFVEVAAAQGIDVRIDRDAISLEGRGYKEISTEELLSGDWSDENINLKAYILLGGPSPINLVEISSFDGSAWSNYSIVGYNINAQYLVSHISYFTGSYKLRVTNATGKTAISPTYLANIDKIQPTFTMSIETTPLQSGTYAGWYTENVHIVITPSQHPNYGLDGYVASLYYSVHNEFTWSEAVDKSGFSFYLDANGVLGGNDFDYRFTVRGRSGIEATYQIEYIPIDTTDYTYTINMYVGDVPDPMPSGVSVFASALNGVSMTYSRGDNPEVSITCAESYTIKEIVESFNGVDTSLVQEQSFIDSLPSYQKNYLTGINHVVWTVKLYKEITLNYSYTKQYKQLGAISSITYEPTDTSFENIFGTLNHNLPLGQTDIGLSITYTPEGGNPSSIIPTSIGVYAVTLSLLDSNLDLVLGNPETTLTVVYFDGLGTYLSPYPISSQADFEMISTYMYFEDGYEIDDPYEYLGENRRSSYFRQTQNFSVSRDMSPICLSGVDYEEVFLGNYNGNGYEISIVDTVNINSSYALFGNVSGTIQNLGVRMNLKINSTASPKTVGMIAIHLLLGTIKNSYAIGSVTLEGDDVMFGALAGLAENSLVAQSFVDVNITATSATGMIGGAVGRLIDNAFCEAIYSSGIIKILNSVPYTNILPLDEVLCFGNIAGHSGALDEGIGPERESLYIPNIIAVDGIPIEDQPICNIDDFMGLMMNAEQASVFLIATEPVIDIVGREKDLGDLMTLTVNIKAASLGVSGSGTEEQPFIIDNSSKFVLVERIPWAHFSQVGDITFTNGQKTQYSYDIPFLGVYSGNNNSIKNIVLEATNISYVGLFSVLKGEVKNLRLVGVDIWASSNLGVYVGALTGLALADASISNVIVSGSININSTEGIVYSGGVVGLLDYATINNALSLASLTIIQSKHSVSGGIIGQVQGISTANQLVSIATVVNNFTNSGSTGRVISSIISSGATVNNLYSVAGSAYSNKKLITSQCVSYSVPTITINVVASYDTIAGSSSTISVGGLLVKNIISGLYPFAEGNGTVSTPFRIGSYRDLLEIGSYMYANFVLTDNILIGDINDDGQLTVDDGYKYDFSPIGSGAAFTGYLDGTSMKNVGGVMTLVKHYIIGLSDVLFEINAGRVANIGLYVNYKVYESEDKIPENEKFMVGGISYTSSKVATPGKDVIYGAVARHNRASANLRNVTVEGNILVRLPGSQKAIVGALVGVDYGASVVANIVEASIEVRSFVAEVGGVIGAVTSNDKSLTYMNTQIVEGELKVTASTMSVGVMVGAIKVKSDRQIPAIIPQIDVYLNNVQVLDPPVYGKMPIPS